MPTVLQWYRKIRKTLADAGLSEADAEARLIVADALGLSLGEIFLKADGEADFDPSGILQKRLSGMPLAYAMNRKYFMGFPFYVDESVLIPRQDTETTVEAALALITEKGYDTVLDLCCGSGCIGISIAKLTPARVLGVDISAAAVRVADKNAGLLSARNFHARASDLFSDVDAKFGLIICNPPYVTEAEYETLESQVKDFEPKDALVGGLDFYEKIAAKAGEYLNPGGALVLETGSGQKDAVRAILIQNGYEHIKNYKDIAGRHRVVVCTIN
jgi:release factor glutamine methyltransferase